MDDLTGFNVVKASGRTEPYDRRKILGSLRRAGAGDSMARAVLEEAEKSFHQGISTKKIFKTVMNILEKHESRATCLYDLKGSIRRLGPAGYPFETYIGEILREYGHRIMLRQVIPGRCATHEIDIVAESDHGGHAEIRLVECKYSRTAGNLVDLKEMMYTWARFVDINEREDLDRKYDGIIMASNNRASKEALKFASCRGVEVLSWNYPPGKGLEQLIQEKDLYPVTILPSASSLDPEIFSKAGLTLVKDFPGQDPGELAIELHIPPPTVAAIIREAGLALSRGEHSCG